MKMRNLLLPIAAALLFASPAFASDLLLPEKVEQAIYNSGPYIGFGGGLSYNDGITGMVNATDGGDASLDAGYNAFARFGWEFDSWGALTPRIDLTGGYLHNGLKDVQLFNAGGPVGTPQDIDGSYSAIYGLGGLIFDWNTGSRFKPFAGVRAGYAQVDVDAAAPAPVGTFLDDSDGVFAWGGTIGLGYEVSRNTTIEISYDFLRFQGVSLAGEFGGLPTVDQDIDNHQVNLGVRIGL